MNSTLAERRRQTSARRAVRETQGGSLRSCRPAARSVRQDPEHRYCSQASGIDFASGDRGNVGIDHNSESPAGNARSQVRHHPMRPELLAVTEQSSTRRGRVSWFKGENVGATLSDTHSNELLSLSVGLGRNFGGVLTPEQQLAQNKSTQNHAGTQDREPDGFG
jgi:hypothetical protein